MEYECRDHQLSIADPVADNAADYDPETKSGEPGAVNVAQLLAGEAELRTPGGENTSADGKPDACGENRQKSSPEQAPGIWGYRYLVDRDTAHRGAPNNSTNKMEQVPIIDSCVARQYSKKPSWLRLCVFVVHTPETESTTKTQRREAERRGDYESTPCGEPGWSEGVGGPGSCGNRLSADFPGARQSVRRNDGRPPVDSRRCRPGQA